MHPEGITGQTETSATDERDELKRSADRVLEFAALPEEQLQRELGGMRLDEIDRLFHDSEAADELANRIREAGYSVRGQLSNRLRRTAEHIDPQISEGVTTMKDPGRS